MNKDNVFAGALVAVFGLSGAAASYGSALAISNYNCQSKWAEAFEAHEDANEILESNLACQITDLLTPIR